MKFVSGVSQLHLKPSPTENQMSAAPHPAAMLRALIALLWLCLQLSAAHAQHDMGLNLAIFEDKTAQLDFDQVRTAEVATQFTPSTKASPSFGYTPSAYWARFTLNDLRPAHATGAHDLQK